MELGLPLPSSISFGAYGATILSHFLPYPLEFVQFIYRWNIHGVYLLISGLPSALIH